LPLGVERIEGNEDLPDPETPVTTVSLPSRTEQEIPLRLCVRAPTTSMLFATSGLSEMLPDSSRFFAIASNLEFQSLNSPTLERILSYFRERGYSNSRDVRRFLWQHGGFWTMT
jgi:hypothetical protein